jgi:hypothetical protein
VSNDFGTAPNLIDLQVEGSRVTGSISRGQEVITIYDGSVAGNVVTFKAIYAAGDRTISYRGTLSGNVMSFTRSVQVRPGGAAGGTGIFGGAAITEFTASRENTAGVAVPRALFGNWKINLQRSSFDPGPAPRPTVSDHWNFVARPGGGFAYAVVSVNNEGMPLMTLATLKADGRDHPRYNAASLAGFLGNATATTITVAARAIDARTLEFTHKNNGVVTATTRMTISQDGNTVTEVVRNVDAQGQTTSTNTLVSERIRPAVGR